MRLQAELGGAARCGTSPTAPWPTGSTPRGWSPTTWAGTSSRRRCSRDGPAGPGMVQLWMESDDAERRPVDIVARGPGPGRLPARPGRATAARRAGDAGPRGLAAAAPDGGLRRRSPTTPTARAATSCRWPAATATASTTASASTSTTSCAPCSGAGPGSVSARRGAGRRAGAGRPPRRLRRATARPAGGPAHASPRSTPCAAAASGCCGRARSRCPRGGWPSIPWPPF